jgi:hypothetical protein
MHALELGDCDEIELKGKKTSDMAQRASLLRLDIFTGPDGVSGVSLTSLS